jgi:hypothetical protein
MIPSWSELTSMDAELKYLGWQRMLACGYHDHYEYVPGKGVKRVRVFVGHMSEPDKPSEKDVVRMPMPHVYYRCDGDPIRNRFWVRYESQRQVRLHLMQRHHRPNLVLLKYCKQQFSDVDEATIEAMVHCALIGDLAQVGQTKSDLLDKVAQDYRTYGGDVDTDTHLIRTVHGPAPEGKGEAFIEWLKQGASGDAVPVSYNYPLVLHTEKHPLPEVVLSVKHARKWCSVRTLTGQRRFLMEDRERLEELGLHIEQPLTMSKREIAQLKLILFLHDWLDEGDDVNYDDTHRVDLGIEPSWAEQFEREHERVQAQVDIRRNDLTDFLPEEKYWEASPDEIEDNLVNLTGVMGKRPMGRDERGRDLDPEFRIGMTYIDLVALESDPYDSHFASEEVVDYVRKRAEINGQYYTFPNKQFLPKDKRKGWLAEVEAAVRGAMAYGGKVRIFHRTSPRGNRWAKTRYYDDGTPVPGRDVGSHVWQVCGSCDRQDLGETDVRQYHRQTQKYESCFRLDLHRDVCLNCGSDKQVVVALAYVPAAALTHLFDFPPEPRPSRHYLRVELYGQYVEYLMRRRYKVTVHHTGNWIEPPRRKILEHRATPARGYAPEYMEDGRIFMMHPQAWNTENWDSQLLSYERKMHGFEVFPKLFDDGYHVVLSTDYGTWVHSHAFDDLPTLEDMEVHEELINWDWLISDGVHHCYPYVYVEREEHYTLEYGKGLSRARAFAAKVRTALRTHQITLANISKRVTKDGVRRWVDVSPHWTRVS